MVLRSGIIIPFQFRDNKKLLMIGVPEENRVLSIWDLKSVVRAAFGIYNFEFRNKKIGFNIPDDLLLHYLAQRRDLTNFVIEIGLVYSDGSIKQHQPQQQPQSLSYEPSCSSQKHIMAMSEKSNEVVVDVPMPNYAISMTRTLKSPLDVTANNSNNSDHSSNPELATKVRIANVYTEHTPESLTQSIDPMDIMPKTDQDEVEMESRALKFSGREQHEHHHQQQQHHHQQQVMAPQTQMHSAPQPQQQLLEQQQQQQEQQQQQQQQQHHVSPQQSNSPHFFGNYSHGPSIGINSTPPTPTPQYSPAMTNRYRRRGERMSKDQKELYVKYFEENPCMLTQRRNDMMLEPHWQKLGTLLNSIPQGAVKNVEEWKQTFDAWRYRVFMYTRYNSKLAGAAAQNPKNYKPLTPTDQRAYAMWTSHKSSTPQDFEKMDMFSPLEETQGEYDY